MKVQIVVSKDGERVPLLVSKKTGMPFYYPTVYVTTEIRTRNVQSETISGKTFSIKHLYAWTKNERIDLEARFLIEGRFLDYSEVKSLQAAVKLKHQALIEQGADIPDFSRRPPKVLSIAKIRRRVNVIKSQYRTSGADTVLRDITEYLDWLAMKGSGQVPSIIRRSDAMDKDRENMNKWLKAGLKTVKGHRNSGASDFREGLSRKDEERLFQLIDPEAKDNPFSHKHAKQRNFVYLKACRLLALRKSEALGLMIDDINFKQSRIMIYRRPDNPDDPRSNEPNAKTLDRELYLPNDLAKLLKTYIYEYRNKFEGCKKHNFIFVAEGSGAPLSKSAANDIFIAIRQSPGLSCHLNKLIEHILRYTWCDRFYDDNKGKIAEKELLDAMIHQCGWSKKTHMVEKYANKAITDSANQAVAKYQKGLVGMDDENANQAGNK